MTCKYLNNIEITRGLRNLKESSSKSLQIFKVFASLKIIKTKKTRLNANRNLQFLRPISVGDSHLIVRSFVVLLVHFQAHEYRYDKFEYFIKLSLDEAMHLLVR